uniref:Uncharacterized protein n=1 Tax=Knipowitschia caucasica TaxID=637954 RepID=A0AAV2LW00_KNICA
MWCGPRKKLVECSPWLWSRDGPRACCGCWWCVPHTRALTGALEGRCARSDCSSSGVDVCGLDQVDAPLSGSNDPDQVIASSFPDTGDTAALTGRAEGWR